MGRRMQQAAEFLAISFLMVPKCVCMYLKNKESNWLREEEIMARKTESHIAANLLLQLFKVSDGQEIK